jgi:hypothetical protein
MAKENIVVFVLARRGRRNENRLERSEERIKSLLTQEIQSVELLTMTSRHDGIETKTKNNKMSMEIRDDELLIRFLKFTVYVDRHRIRQVSYFPPCKTIVSAAIWQLPSSPDDWFVTRLFISKILHAELRNRSMENSFEVSPRVRDLEIDRPLQHKHTQMMMMNAVQCHVLLVIRSNMTNEQTIWWCIFDREQTGMWDGRLGRRASQLHVAL